MVVSDLRRHQACMRRRREQGCAAAAHFEQPEDLRGPGVGLKLAACESHGAIGIEGQDGLIREAPGIFQGFLVEGLLVALHHDLKGDAPHLSILLEAIVLPAKQSSVKRPGSPWAPSQMYNMSARLPTIVTPLLVPPALLCMSAGCGSTAHEGTQAHQAQAQCCAWCT